MTDSPHSDASHGSFDESTGANSNRAPAVKDKQCQYCKQPFTSSSLGRHLDQYLRKKKPDGVHDVDEIRRLRGGITRRTARQSKAHDHEGTPATNGTPPAHQASPPVPPAFDHLNGVPAGGLEVRLNGATWHTTGVITDLSNPSTMSPSTPNTTLSTKRPFSSLSVPDSSNTDKDTTRALELALREVLDSLRAATARASPRPSPFTFDLQAQTFPSLVITLLPTPPSLFSPSPFATSTSAPLEPPSSTQLELLRLNLSTKIQRWKWDSLRTAQSRTFPTPAAANLGEEADYLSRTALKYEELATKHVDLAYSTWMSHSLEARQQMWQVELMRALATEQAKTKEMEARIERITQEANRLQGQVETLSRCQWPREMALWPPERVLFSKEEVNEIRAINLVGGNDAAVPSSNTGDRWEYERLVGKWKKHVREDKSRRTGVAVQNQTLTQTANPPKTSTSLPSLAVATSTSENRTLPTLVELDHYHSQVSGAGANTTKRPRLYETNGKSSPQLHTNGTNTAEEYESEIRRKSMRQQQRQHLVTDSADQTEELREWMHDMQDMQ